MNSSARSRSLRPRFGCGRPCPALLAAIAFVVSSPGRAQVPLAELPGYVELKGDDAKRMIVGDTLLSVDDGEQKLTYYRDENSEYVGAGRGSRECTILPVSVTTTDIRAHSHIIAYRIFKARSVDAGRAPRGALIGLIYYSGPFSGQKDSFDKVLKGNLSECPEMAPSPSAQPLEISKSEWDAANGQERGKQASADARRRFLIRILVGNTLIRYDKSDNSCDGDDLYSSSGYYFATDGRYAFYLCTAHDFHKGKPNDHEVGMDHWKATGGKLCLQRPQPDDPDAYSACDDFVLHAVPASANGDRIRLEVTDADDRGGNPANPAPYLVVKGNPMNFRWPADSAASLK
jgi:hypothetical protein